MRWHGFAVSGIICIPAFVWLAGCDMTPPSGASRETQQTELISQQASVVVGMPAITNFTEKRLLKTIYELRDQANLVTYTYYLDLQGRRHKVCPTNSVGFPVPYATQYTAPTGMQRWTLPSMPGWVNSYGVREAPQPEPNGLHMPSSAEGTWVVCVNPDTKEMAPTYVEDRVQTYLFQMPSVEDAAPVSAEPEHSKKR
jgi:hypothetical protein